MDVKNKDHLIVDYIEYTLQDVESAMVKLQDITSRLGILYDAQSHLESIYGHLTQVRSEIAQASKQLIS